MKFYSSFDPPKCKPAPTGNGKEIDWQLKLVKGVEEIVNAGEIDIYSQIQACAEGTPTVSELVSRFVVTQDPSIFEAKKSAEFFDLTKVPKDIFEIQSMQREAQLQFDRLPLEIKQKYNNNLYEFIQDDKSCEVIRDYINKDYSSRLEAFEKENAIKIQKESAKSEVKKDE